MRENFAESLRAVLIHEGGYVNHPKDPGGATNKGITHRTYTAWLRQHNQPVRSVKEITDEEVAAIYKAQYWDAVRGDDLPSGLDYAVFDFAVNSGPARAAQFVQRIVGVDADGVIGAQTLAAIGRTSAKQVVAELCAARLTWLKRLKTWATFGKGWARRVAEVRAKAIRLAEASYVHVTGPEASEPAPGKASGPESTTATIKDVLSDKGAVGGVAGVLGAAGTLLGGNGPVQYAIAAVLVMAALTGIWWLVRGRQA
ncbi:glycoside hydrolase family 108 protein [Oceaniglobus trochenteri]|uniref:glycoside hydrolase family 108 protein n=1 Tax=Oceaniglobus trochenteri TaxID=2763260 RepID=UPI001CFFD2D2|nr:glycoside hydrolase family 108 protein [Oceaniglobus trochenteri]